MPSHRIVEEWMGERIETLADLLPPQPIALCIGINPSPPSVAVGHYYQGQLGKRFWARLRLAGLIPPTNTGFEDDAAVAAGLGFTDVVKRPTGRATGLRPGELIHGAELLRAKIERLRAPVVICTYKTAAEALLGRIYGHGWIDGRTVGVSRVFVMPGPYELTERVEAALASLRSQLRET